MPDLQKPGCGWPLINLAGIFCLSSGALLRAAHGPWKTSEARLFALLRRTLRAGGILVADRGFWSYANLAFLPMRALDFVVRGRYAKRIDWRNGQRLGKDDRLITMKRPADKDARRVMSARLWTSLPQTITVRQGRVPITRPGFHTQSLLLITALLGPVLWPVETLPSLYPRRWRVELYFDDIKTTMHAANLRCLTPGMVRRELLLHAIADNLIRRSMLESAWQHGAPLDQLSFTATQASGSGYTGLNRYYDVETTTDLANAASWTGVSGYTNIAGANQTVTVTQPLTGGPRFYHLKVRVQ